MSWVNDMSLTAVGDTKLIPEIQTILCFLALGLTSRYHDKKKSLSIGVIKWITCSKMPKEYKGVCQQPTSTNITENSVWPHQNQHGHHDQAVQGRDLAPQAARPGHLVTSNMVTALCWDRSLLLPRGSAGAFDQGHGLPRSSQVSQKEMNQKGQP